MNILYSQHELTMITTVSDLLEQFKKYALSKIEAEEKNITHRTAIGEMFEGVTSKLLGMAVFKELNLRIVERSFIYNDSGNVSAEIDCMLVTGEGIEVSFTDRYKYHIKDVIAVIQVKTNLFGNDIEDSHKNLRSVIRVSEPRDAEAFVNRLHRDAYETLTSKPLPTDERRTRFNDREDIIFHLLRMEAFHPLRIVIGYYGYTDEYALREGFINKMEEITKNGPVEGYGPGSFPNLYICGDSTIIKGNGMPYGFPFKDEDFYWNILFSSYGRPMYHLLELIWTRLSYKFEISSQIFGDNLEIENVHPFISCREKKLGENKWGWEYYYYNLSKEMISKPLYSTPWVPVEITKEQFTILWVLTKTDKIDTMKDERFLEFIKNKKLDAAKIITELKELRLVYLDEGIMGLLVHQLVFAKKDDKMYAGENRNGEMRNYFGKQIIENNQA